MVFKDSMYIREPNGSKREITWYEFGLGTMFVINTYVAGFLMLGIWTICSLMVYALAGIMTDPITPLRLTGALLWLIVFFGGFVMFFLFIKSVQTWGDQDCSELAEEMRI